MAISKNLKPSPGKTVSSGRRVTLNPKVARRSFLKLSAATAALSGAAMTTKLTGKAVAAEKTAPYAEKSAFGRGASEGSGCSSRARIRPHGFPRLAGRQRSRSGAL